MGRHEIREAIWLFLQYIVSNENTNQHKHGRFNLYNHLLPYFENNVASWHRDNPLDKKILYEEIHSMITANVLFGGDIEQTMGTEAWYTITEFGKKCINANNTLPFDPDGYIEGISQRIQNIDKVVLDYLQEAIVCYDKVLLLSSTICLGVASERCSL